MKSSKLLLALTVLFAVVLMGCPSPADTKNEDDKKTEETGGTENGGEEQGGSETPLTGLAGLNQQASDVSEAGNWAVSIDAFEMGTTLTRTINDKEVTLEFDIAANVGDDWPYGAYSFSTDPVISFTEATKVTFEYKLDGVASLTLSNKEDGSDYNKSLDAASDWTSITLTLGADDFAQPSWAGAYAFDLAAVKGLSFDFGAGESGTFSIRNVVFE